MSNQKYNPNITCNVADCRYNHNASSCCTLNQICVNCEQKNVTSEHGTCCHSFECKQ
ncbi:MAG: DUF1540 domain-containing protein [Oscillospiraceae bacterium]|nr:DUF1540 domain-containing protein [Oscillospiraceae bacterium]